MACRKMSAAVFGLSLRERVPGRGRRPIEPALTSDLIADLGFDSLQVLEVITELEDRFDITHPGRDRIHRAHGRTVADVVAQVSALVEGGRAS